MSSSGWPSSPTARNQRANDNRLQVSRSKRLTSVEPVDPVLCGLLVEAKHDAVVRRLDLDGTQDGGRMAIGLDCDLAIAIARLREVAGPHDRAPRILVQVQVARNPGAQRLDAPEARDERIINTREPVDAADAVLDVGRLEQR